MPGKERDEGGPPRTWRAFVSILSLFLKPG